MNSRREKMLAGRGCLETSERRLPAARRRQVEEAGREGGDPGQQSCRFCPRNAVIAVHSVPLCVRHFEELRKRAGGSAGLNELTEAEILLFGEYYEGPTPSL